MLIRLYPQVNGLDGLGISGSLRLSRKVIVESHFWNTVLSQMSKPFAQRTEGRDFIKPMEETVWNGWGLFVRFV